MKLRQTKWIIALVMVAIGIGIIVTTTLPEATKYYLTVDELYLKPDMYQNMVIKVAGKVASKSIVHTDTQWTFGVVNKDQTISVSYKGIMPDTFKEGADVVVEGKYLGTDKFVATTVLAKCASRYEEKLKPTLMSPQSSQKG